MKMDQVTLLPRRAIGGHWFRAIKPKYAGRPLDLAYTADHWSRYSPGIDAAHRPFETLYLAEDPIVALREVEAIYGSVRLVPNPIDAWCLFPYQLALNAVVDLTDATSLALISTSLQEITGRWGPPFYPRGTAPTQQLGEAVFRQDDTQGIVFPSARAGGINLVVFPEKVTGTAWIRCKDAGGVEYRIP
jgi:RES domain-containing protein